MLREEKIKNLMAAHDFNRALATSIALERADLKTILLRRRKNETLETNYSRSCLEAAREDSVSLGLAVHGHKRLRGRVLSIDKYSFQLLTDGSADPEEIHKTVVKYAYNASDFKLVRKAHNIDNRVKKLALEPIVRVKDRHHFKNLTLQQAIDDGTQVEVITLEGDVFRGKVRWFGRWEFEMIVKGDVKVTVFRHGVYRLTPYKKGEGKSGARSSQKGGKSGKKKARR